MSAPSDSDAGAMWNARFAHEAYVYGTEPNDFLRERAPLLPSGGFVASLGEGEGRNATFLASLGHRVLAIDASSIGLEKARRLADQRGVSLETVVADLGAYDFPIEAWDGAVLIFCHLPPQLRERVHRSVARALKPGGVVLLEAYTPRQLSLGTGGPKIPELLYSEEQLRSDFGALEIVHVQELTREVREGSLHTGTAAVVQLVARKPAR